MVVNKLMYQPLIANGALQPLKTQSWDDAGDFTPLGELKDPSIFRGHGFRNMF